MEARNLFVPVKLVKGYTERLSAELTDVRLHPKILLMLFDLGYYSYEKWREPIVVTHIFRTPEKQKEIYGPNTTKISPHMLWRAVDVVPESGDESWYAKAEAYIDGRYPYLGSAGYTSSDAHNVGLGKHLHLQVGFNEPFNKERFENGQDI